MSFDLDALEKTALEAGYWGQWAIWEDLTSDGFVHVGNADGVIPEGEIATPEGAEANPIAKCYTRGIAEYIAAFNPETALALIAELRIESSGRLGALGMVKDAVAERDALQARLDKVRTALGNHSTCDTYEDGETCGWKRAVADVTKAIGETDEH